MSDRFFDRPILNSPYVPEASSRSERNVPEASSRSERNVPEASSRSERLLETKWRDPGEEPELHLFGHLKTTGTERRISCTWWWRSVVTLDDGETVHNTFFDRGFRRGMP